MEHEQATDFCDNRPTAAEYMVVLNPNASEASYKPKQRRHRKTLGGGEFSGGEYT